MSCLEKTCAHCCKISLILISPSGIRSAACKSHDLMCILYKPFSSICASSICQLEAACQLLDPDRNGFVDLPSVLSSFHSLCPLLDTVHDKMAAQRLSLVVLTIACEDLARRGKDLNHVLSEVIAARRHEVSSFHEFMSSISGGGTKAEPESSDIVRMQDIEVIADLLYEFTAHFFEAHSTRDGRPLSLSLPEWSIRRDIALSSPSKPSRAGVAAKRVIGITSAEMMEFLSTHLRDVCTDIARSFRIYMTAPEPAHSSSGRSPVLASVATLFVTYMCFRRSVLSRSGSNPTEPLSLFIGHEGTISSSHPSALLLPQQALLASSCIEQHVYNVLGRDRATTALARSEAISAEDFELVMAQLLSMPIPVGRGQSVGLALSACQLDVEGYLMDRIGTSEIIPTSQEKFPRRLDTRSYGRMYRTQGTASSDDLQYHRNHRDDRNTSPTSTLGRAGNKDEAEESTTQINSYLIKLNSNAEELKIQIQHLLKLQEASVLIKRSGLDMSAEKQNDRNTVLNSAIRIYKRLQEEEEKVCEELTCSCCLQFDYLLT